LFKNCWRFGNQPKNVVNRRAQSHTCW
jgi:hypothetical protein